MLIQNFLFFEQSGVGRKDGISLIGIENLITLNTVSNYNLFDLKSQSQRGC